MTKMSQTLYFSLLVIALCSLSEGIQRRYHYINMEKTWTEAQRYCRENYTDLATVNNINDMNELKKTVNNNQKVWIGLKRTGVYKWKWSLGDPVKYLNWETEPSNVTNNCTIMRNGKWLQQDCNVKSQFICYNDNSKSYIIITSDKTWSEAQSFCRQYHTDLTSVRNQTDNQLIHNIINDPHTSVWIGLFRDSWEWSDNTDSAFRYWRAHEPNNAGGSEDCADSIMTDNGEWFDTSCNLLMNFVCHEDELILIQKNLSWTEAVRYCRENHVDLVSVDSREIQLWVKAAVHQASTAEVWLGLRLSCSVGIWFWVNGEIACYQNWAPGNETAVDDCEREVRSGAVQSGGDHLWISLPESKQLNFICIRHD
ncbi:C-type mannose receptor 2-like [Triplophysa dalaica]|uniref:C-type mannose receptor 2-like n=1 Tax=Triplophysa dalaica TaxID=1582913 RepID=UPI0024DF7271|nr:C-type mannose receptor 2-like [Triplophysa dalaica]XP_056604812.1 C-type mannose receptor 2-like [Triplophysa dalaica]